MGATAGGGADGLRSPGREPNRRMRLLDHRWFDHDVVELPAGALMAPPFLILPRLQDQTEGFLEDRSRVRHIDVEPVKLVIAVAFADAEIKAPIGNQIEGSCLLHQQDRIVP